MRLKKEKSSQSKSEYTPETLASHGAELTQIFGWEQQTIKIQFISTCSLAEEKKECLDQETGWKEGKLTITQDYICFLAAEFPLSIYRKEIKSVKRSKIQPNTYQFFIIHGHHCSKVLIKGLSDNEVAQAIRAIKQMMKHKSTFKKLITKPEKKLRKSFSSRYEDVIIKEHSEIDQQSSDDDLVEPSATYPDDTLEYDHPSKPTISDQSDPLINQTMNELDLGSSSDDTSDNSTVGGLVEQSNSLVPPDYSDQILSSSIRPSSELVALVANESAKIHEIIPTVDKQENVLQLLAVLILAIGVLGGIVVIHYYLLVVFIIFLLSIIF